MNTYRIASVHPADQRLLGICLQGQVFVDRVLKFVLRSVPKVFTAIADFLAWFLFYSGVSYLVHYLDNFFILVPPGIEACSYCGALESLIDFINTPRFLTTIHKASQQQLCFLDMREAKTKYLSKDHKKFWKHFAYLKKSPQLPTQQSMFVFNLLNEMNNSFHCLLTFGLTSQQVAFPHLHSLLSYPGKLSNVHTATNE